MGQGGPPQQMVQQPQMQGPPGVLAPPGVGQMGGPPRMTPPVSQPPPLMQQPIQPPQQVRFMSWDCCVAVYCKLEYCNNRCCRFFYFEHFLSTSFCLNSEIAQIDDLCKTIVTPYIK